MPAATQMETTEPYKSKHNRLGTIHKKVDNLKIDDAPSTPKGRARPTAVAAATNHHSKNFDPTMVDRKIGGVTFIDEESAKKGRGKTAKKATKAPKKKSAAKKASRNPLKALRPQCAAVTEDGAQCRNSARLTSKYCGSHKGFRPKASHGKAKDTKPRVAKAKDTAPARRKTASKATHRPQCAATTPEGKQCRNSARENSKYCGSHKGFRPKASHGKAKDTKPRVAKAKDTAPSKRKATVKKAAKKPAKKPASKTAQKNARCAAKTADGKRCKNSSRDRSKYCASHKGYRP